MQRKKCFEPIFLTWSFNSEIGIMIIGLFVTFYPDIRTPLTIQYIWTVSTRALSILNAGTTNMQFGINHKCQEFSTHITLPKLQIILKNASNKSCSELKGIAD